MKVDKNTDMQAYISAHINAFQILVERGVESNDVPHDPEYPALVEKEYGIIASRKPNWDAMSPERVALRETHRQKVALAELRKRRTTEVLIRAKVWCAENYVKCGTDEQRLKAYQRGLSIAKNRRQAHVKSLHSRRLREAMPPWADKEKIRAIYDEADRLTKETGIPHEVDHIHPLIGKDGSIGLHVHYNLRAIPQRINRSKGNRLE